MWNADPPPPFSLVMCITAKEQKYPYTRDLHALEMGGSTFVPAIEAITDKLPRPGLEKVLARWHSAGFLALPNNLNINRFGVIPKRHQPGKWRLITDLSYPHGLRYR